MISDQIALQPFSSTVQRPVRGGRQAARAGSLQSERWPAGLAAPSDSGPKLLCWPTPRCGRRPCSWPF